MALIIRDEIEEGKSDWRRTRGPSGVSPLVEHATCGMQSRPNVGWAVARFDRYRSVNFMTPPFPFRPIPPFILLSIQNQAGQCVVDHEVLHGYLSDHHPGNQPIIIRPSTCSMPGPISASPPPLVAALKLAVFFYCERVCVVCTDF